MSENDNNYISTYLNIFIQINHLKTKQIKKPFCNISINQYYITIHYRWFKSL